MKRIFNILAVAVLALGMASCAKIEQEDAFSTAPVAPELYAHNDILITNNTLGEDVTFSWSAYRFLPEGLQYTLYAVYDIDPVVLATTKERSVSWTKAAFASLLKEKIDNLPENDIFSILLYVAVPNGNKELKSANIRVSVYSAGDAVEPVITEVMEETVLDPSEPTALIPVLSWEPARLVYGEKVTYDVFVSLPETKADEEPVAPKKAKLTTEPIEETSLIVTVDALNEAIVAAGGVEDAENDILFEVVAYCASLPEGVVSSAALATVTTYLATFPEVLYVPGNYQGWDPASAPTLKHSKVTKGFYQGIINLTTTDGAAAMFKFSPVPEWKDDFGGKVEVNAAGSGAFATAEGTVGVADNIEVPSGVYYIELDKKFGEIRMVQFETLSLIGSAVGDFSWGSDVDLVYDAQKQEFSATTEFKSGEFKMRFNHNWDMALGGDSETGYTLAGGNIAVEKDGEYKIVVDASVVPFAIKFINTSFPEQLYVPGSHNGWDHSKTSFAGNGEGQYEGFANLGGEWGFKFTPAPNWDNGEWGFLKNSAPVEDGIWTTYQLTDSDAGNILEASEITYYKAVVNLTDLTLKVTPITSVGIIGGFVGNSWASDMYPMEYNADKDCWVAKEVEIIKGTEWKFRMNEAWDINLGGALDNLTQDGSNIKEEEGAIYDVALYINTTPYHAVITKTGESDFVDTTEGPWSIIGAIGESNWDTDFDMEKNGTTFIYKDLALTTADEFKLRFDHEWAFNRGADTAEEGAYTLTLGEAVAVVNNGANMKVPADGSYDIYYDASKETVTIYEAGTVFGDTWSVVGIDGDWNTDIDMTEVAPGIFVSPVIEAASEGCKVRLNHDWAVNRGCASLANDGVFVDAFQNGGNIPLSGKYQLVYNANTDMLGTLVWGVVGSVASLPGFNWNNDVPMNLGADGKWYSIAPVTLAATDLIKIRKYGAWDVNRGGAFAAAEEAIAVTHDGANITGAEGAYMVVYDPVAETITLTAEFWGIVGEFNGWGNDLFMMNVGDGKWYAGGMTATDGWKIRKGAAWAVNRGGSFEAAGTPFDVVHDGSNITVSGLESYSVTYDSVAETITVQ